VFSRNESHPEPGEPVEFDGTQSSDSDGSIVSYDWDFDDGTTTSGDVVTHSFSEGTYTVELNVTDDEGSSVVTTNTVEVAPDTAPTADFDAEKTGMDVEFDASDSGDDDGTVDEYQWEFGDGNTATTADPVITHTYSNKGDYTVNLTVVDDDSNTSTTSKTVSVGNNDPTVTIDSTTKTGSGSWDADVEHTADDEDLDLDTVTVTLFDSSGSAITSKSYDATGEEGNTNTTSFTGLSTEPVSTEVEAEDDDGHTATEKMSFGGSNDPTFSSTDVNDKTSGGNAKFDVSWDVDDPTGDSEFEQVEVTYEWDGGTRDLTDSSQTDEIKNEKFTGEAGTSFAIRVAILDKSGTVIECREYVTTADGTSPGATEYTTC